MPEPSDALRGSCLCGGVRFEVADELEIPLRFVGVGEGLDDLQEFAAEDFVEALFSRTT